MWLRLSALLVGARFLAPLQSFHLRIEAKTDGTAVENRAADICTTSQSVLPNVGFHFGDVFRCGKVFWVTWKTQLRYLFCCRKRMPLCMLCSLTVLGLRFLLLGSFGHCCFITVSTFQAAMFAITAVSSAVLPTIFTLRPFCLRLRSYDERFGNCWDTRVVKISN